MTDDMMSLRTLMEKSPDALKPGPGLQASRISHTRNRPANATAPDRPRKPPHRGRVAESPAEIAGSLAR